jgi:hypothetical protein
MLESIISIESTQSCPFFIQLSTTSDGKRLVINKLCEDHNHEIHETLFKFLPPQRQLSGDERKDVEICLRFKKITRWYSITSWRKPDSKIICFVG